jgi:O-antigen ligase
VSAVTLRAQGLLVLAFGGALLAAALDVLVAYRFAPAAAAVLPIAVVLGVLVLRDPLFGVCAGLLAIPLETFGVAAGGFGFTASEIVLVGTSGAVALRMAFDGDGRPVAAPHRALAALVFVMACSIAVAGDPVAVVKVVTIWTSLVLVSIYVAGQDASRIETVMVAVATAGGLVGVIAVSGASAIELQEGGAIAQGRAVGSFDQPNLLGFFAALSIPVGLVLAARGSLLRRAVMVGAVGFAFAGVLLSLSRTSLIGTGLALLVLLAWPAFRRVSLVGLAVLAVFAMANMDALQSSEQLQVVGQRLGTLRDRDAVDDGRAEMWAQTPQMVADHWVLGVGPANYVNEAPSYGIRGPDGLEYVHAHNVPLTVAAESGLTGLAALLAALGLLAAAARRALRDRASARWPLTLGLVAALSTLLVTGAGDYPLTSNPIVATILVEVGLLVGLARLAQRDGAASTPA